MKDYITEAVRENKRGKKGTEGRAGGNGYEEMRYVRDPMTKVKEHYSGVCAASLTMRVLLVRQENAGLLLTSAPCFSCVMSSALARDRALAQQALYALDRLALGAFGSQNGCHKLELQIGLQGAIERFQHGSMFVTKPLDISKALLRVRCGKRLARV